MLVIMLLSNYCFVIGVFEGTYMVSFILYFDGTRDDVGGPYGGLTIRYFIVLECKLTVIVRQRLLNK